MFGRGKGAKAPEQPASNGQQGVNTGAGLSPQFYKTLGKTRDVGKAFKADSKAKGKRGG